MTLRPAAPAAAPVLGHTPPAATSPPTAASSGATAPNSSYSSSSSSSIVIGSGAAAAAAAAAAPLPVAKQSTARRLCTEYSGRDAALVPLPAEYASSQLRGCFIDEIANLIECYGFRPPHPHKVVAYLESCAIEFVQQVCDSIRRTQGRSKRVGISEVLDLFRMDPELLGRMEEILAKERKLAAAKRGLKSNLSDIAQLGELDSEHDKSDFDDLDLDGDDDDDDGDIGDGMDDLDGSDFSANDDNRGNFATLPSSKKKAPLNESKSLDPDETSTKPQPETVSDTIDKNDTDYHFTNSAANEFVKCLKCDLPVLEADTNDQIACSCGRKRGRSEDSPTAGGTVLTEFSSKIARFDLHKQDSENAADNFSEKKISGEEAKFNVTEIGESDLESNFSDLDFHLKSDNEPHNGKES